MAMELIAQLIEAVMVNDVKTATLCLDLGADPNGYEDMFEVTPLHFAASFEAYECAQLLLERGANPRALTIDGQMPYEIAWKKENLPLMWLLLEAPEQISKKSYLH